VKRREPINRFIGKAGIHEYGRQRRIGAPGLCRKGSQSCFEKLNSNTTELTAYRPLLVLY
jgi:hypothetical protein